MEETLSKKIGILAMIVSIVLALVADALTLIPFVGIAVGPIFWISFNYYLHKKGFPIMSGKRLGTGIISTIAEIIPAIQALPTITLGVIAILVMIYFQEKTGVPVTSIADGKVGPKNNMNGVRQPPPRPTLNQGRFRPPNSGLAAS
jgi:hypothetical protein